jgi:hypothetical protein
MRYRDLIQFEPVEIVVQLRWADELEDARRLVKTYVISERMTEILTDLIIPHLRFDKPYDHRGILIVGNYGSGKSHLMSVLSAVAHWADLRDEVSHSEVAQALEPIAGRFQVLRMEVGTTQMPLRDIVLKDKLEPFLRGLGIDVSFPSMVETSNTKDPLLAAMAAFQERYPEQGLLIVVDELLDYLRGRKDQELILDLSFLREVGEVCRLGRFRFVAGVQEALFDSPRFQFAADAVRRVRDRFEQVRITREDVAYVVSERLLRKTREQQADVRSHLQRFTPFYGEMAERLDEFVVLFPVHPAYLEVFERITFAEQRVALKAISQTMRGMLDQEVPSDAPGLVSYDSYWPLLASDPSFRTSPEIREVMEKSKVLSDRVAHAYTRPKYRQLAGRLIDALSVLRLTTGDIYAPIGATPEELRDGLALFDPNLPEQDADFLRATVETALREIVRTASGQFISVNPDNGQYYLDLKKDVDYDAKIEERTATLGAEQLNRRYFEALRELMGQDETTYVTGYRIWEYEVPWPERRVTRPGYLFFGTPNERSTAQPPRDFYLYFLQPHETPPFDDEQRAEEVFFRLVEPDGEFDQALRTYAGAWEMSLNSSGVHQRTYQEKADRAKQEVTKWLRTHPDALMVTHQGESRPLLQWERLGVGVGQDVPFREVVQGVAAGCLVPFFEETYPYYPAFTALRQPITRESRPKMIQDALRYIASQRTQSGAAVLDGLGLLDGEHVRPEHSPYAHHILELLGDKEAGEVVNRDELVEPWMGTERMRHFRVEPDYLVAVLMALVYSGEIEMTLPGRKIDAAVLEEAVRIPLDDLANFRYIARPRDLPLGALVATFELLDLPPGLIQKTATHDPAVEELQKRAGEELNRVVALRERVRKGLSLWGGQVLEGRALDTTLAHVDAYRAFLESLRPFNTPGKLRNFSHTAESVREQRSRQKVAREVAALADQVAELQPLTAYLREAASLLPEEHALVGRIRQAQEEHLATLRNPDASNRPEVAVRLRQELENLKREYVQAYLDIHQRARLNSDQDRDKVRLTRDPRLRQLRLLATWVGILPETAIDEIERRLGDMVSCWRLIPADLEREPSCPHCGLRPTEAPKHSASELLGGVDDKLDTLAENWLQTLRESLGSPTVRESLDLMAPSDQERLEGFQDQGDLPDPLDEPFLQALSQALGGLERVTIPPEDILMALAGSGAPRTMSELRQQFDQLLEQYTAGKDPDRVRIVIEW